VPETSRFFGIVIGMFHDEHPPPHFTLGMAFIRTRAHAATNIPQDSTARDAIPRLREDIATTINSMIGGVRVGKYSAGGRRVDVRMRLLAAQRTRPEDLGRLRLRSGSGELVPLTALVREEERPALQAIFFYLVRAQNSCPGAAGFGPLGFDSAGSPTAGRSCP